MGRKYTGRVGQVQKDPALIVPALADSKRKFANPISKVDGLRETRLLGTQSGSRLVGQQWFRKAENSLLTDVIILKRGRQRKAIGMADSKTVVKVDVAW